MFEVPCRKYRNLLNFPWFVSRYNRKPLWILLGFYVANQHKL